MNILVGACLIWLAASLAAYLICRKIKRERLLREARAEAERVHLYHEWLRRARGG